jgi:bifunctional N-acetylglutamate synthase/kinase
MNPSDVVLTFLASIGSRSEVEFYLNLFRSERPESFAIIKVCDGVDRNALDLDLGYLHKLGLQPLVAGAGDDLAALAAARRTRKIIFLVPGRGLEPAGRPVPSQVDLTTEYDELSPLLPESQRALLRTARDLIDSVAHTMSVAVTSPLDMLRELFTVRGAGTMIRRGARVTRHSSYDDIDLERLHQVIESAFGAPPPVDLFSRPMERVYVAGDYDGAAIVTASPIGPYLSKFAVDRRARGEGIGRDIWRAMRNDSERLFWRSRPDNPITQWYVQQCDGMARTNGWCVFWRGLAIDELPQAIGYAGAAPHDFP